MPPLEPSGAPLVEDADRWIDPVAALGNVATRPGAVLLCSALTGHPASRWSILASDPVAVVEVTGRRAVVLRSGGRAPERSVHAGDPFDLLRALTPSDPGARAPGLPFAGGAIGWFGYGLRRAIERLPAGPPEPLRQPDIWLGLYDAAAVFDHATGRVALVAVPGADGEAGARARLRAMRGLLAGASARPPVPPPHPGPRMEAHGVTPRRAYLAAVRQVLEHIARGDVYQVNLSHRLEAPLRETPADLFARLAADNPAPFAAYLDTGRARVACASPERFVSLRADLATSSPIKGTRPRGGDESGDRALAQGLVGSAKDRAENVMIADLVRNDLGRVCATGSVRADRLCELQSFATVHHLVSTISGRLRAGRDRVDLLRALFPGGSMTGAPKIRAMQIITDLEGEERGLYSGAIGYLSLDGDMDLNIVIRTIVCGGGRAHLRVGGGIVADSDPQAEYRETLDKAAALLDALGCVFPDR